MLLETVSYRAIFVFCSIFPAGVAFVAYNFDETANYTIERSSFIQDIKKVSGIIFAPNIRNLLICAILLVVCPTFGIVWNFYLTEKLHFSPKVMGQMNFMAVASYLVGIISINTIFRGVPFKKFYITVTMAWAVCAFLSVIQIERWNLMIGINDFWFCITSGSLLNFISELCF